MRIFLVLVLLSLFFSGAIAESQDRYPFESSAQEQQFNNAVEQYLGGLEQRVIGRVADLFPQKQFEKEIIDQEAEIEKLIAILSPILLAVAVRAANNGNELIGVETPFIVGQSAEDTIRRQITKFAKSMLNTDADKLANIIATGFNEGQGVAKVTQEIQNQFPQFARSQANRVSRSELLRTSNNFAQEAWEASDLVIGKRWRTDADPCPYCAPLDGRPIELTAKFFDKGTEWFGDAKSPLKLDYDSVKYPPLHPNCECTIEPIIVGESIKGANTKKMKSEMESQKDYIKELEELLEID